MKRTGLTIKTVHSDEKDKLETLFKLICYLATVAIVFCNHRESVERTSKILKKKILSMYFIMAQWNNRNETVPCVNSEMDSNILVTTDLAARGLDIPNIRYIIHYHLPHTEDIFTHRNGRTARMDASGTAILILSPEEKLPAYIHAMQKR